MRSDNKPEIQSDTAKPRLRTTQNELTTFLAPLADGLKVIWRRVHFVTLGVFGLYAVSGVTIIEADEVGVTLRLGEVTRSGGQPVIHAPGIVFALPRPFDEVIKIEADRIDTITIQELAPQSWQIVQDNQSIGLPVVENPVKSVSSPVPTSIDPETYGYVLTGDRNILHTQIIVRYRVSNPVDFTLLTSSPVDSLRSVLLQSTIKVAGETHLDDLLGSGRELFTRAVGNDAQLRLDRIGAGLEIVSLEFENLSPPEQVAADFDAVQSAYIEAQTSRQEARSYAAAVIPAARADAKEIVSRAQASSEILISTARAQADTFAALLPAYRANPGIVRHRLYREGIEQALKQAGRVRFVPPPPAEGYQGTRFSISPFKASQSAPVLTEATESVSDPDATSANVSAPSSSTVFPLTIGGENQ